MRAPTRIAVAITAALSLAGCGTMPKAKFQCASTGGVACMSTSELYEATHDADRVNRRPEATPQAFAGGADELRLDGSALRFADPEPAIALPSQIPVRTPAKVMRLWIAPWVDDAGDLNLAGHVFTEIEARKWSVGERGIDTVPVFSPLQVGTQASTDAASQTTR